MHMRLSLSARAYLCPLAMAAAPTNEAALFVGRSRKRRKARSKRSPNPGGYDCEFVAPLPEAI